MAPNPFTKLWRNSNSAVSAAQDAVAHLKPAVIVTGGSRGIGLAIAMRFARAGHPVVLVARNAAGLSKAIATLKGGPDGLVRAVACDVTRSDAAGTIISGVREAGFFIDVLVNAAGIGLAGPFVGQPPGDISRLIALNIESLTRLTRTTLPDMLARRRGGIINISSLGAAVPGPDQAVYYASKAFVSSFSEAIASEARWSGVRICAVLPGPVDTDFHARMGADTSLYRLLLPSLSPDRVAASAYRGYMLGSRVVVPGLFYSAMYLGLRFMPHFVTVPITGALLKTRGH